MEDKKYTFTRDDEGRLGLKIIRDEEVVDNKGFEKELKKVRGVGEKTVKDILRVYPTKKDLLKTISNGERLPFNDLVEERLLEKYK